MSDLVRKTFFDYLLESCCICLYFMYCFWIFSINAIDPKTKKILQLLRLRQVTSLSIDFISHKKGLQTLSSYIFLLQLVVSIFCMDCFYTIYEIGLTNNLQS